VTFRPNGGPAGSGTKFPGLRERPKDWACACGVTHPGYQTRCWVSDEKRPAARVVPMIYVALALIAALAILTLALTNVVARMGRQHAREREQLLNKIMHLAGKTWVEPPREPVPPDEAYDPSRFSYAPEQDPEI
jgi:hypothetical protein